MKYSNAGALALVIVSTSMPLHADVKPLSDQQLGDISGQTGVTLELETKVDIGQLKYTDEGSLNIDDITLEGAIPGSLLDDVKIEIDLLSDGDAVIKMTPISGTPIDASFSFGVMGLSGLTGESTQLASNFNSVGLIRNRIYTLDAATGTFTRFSETATTDLDVDFDFLAVSIRDVTIHGKDFEPGITTAADDAFYTTTEMTFSAIANPRTASGQALNIGFSTYNADIYVGAVEIGGKSIGQLAIDDLVVSNTNLQIYGH